MPVFMHHVNQTGLKSWMRARRGVREAGEEVVASGSRHSPFGLSSRESSC